MPETSINPSSQNEGNDSEPEPASRFDSAATQHKRHENPALFDRISRFFSKSKNDGQSLREAIEDLIDDHNDTQNNSDSDIQASAQERVLISNILKLQESTVDDVMIPRADIIAIEVDSSQEELLSLLSQHQYSRIPVYRETLDDVIGTVHIKDILAQLAAGKKIAIKDIIRDIPIVSPAMSVLDLILFMKEKRKHMVLVIDEYGGIDGLVTLGDVIEIVLGEIEDEYDTAQHAILAQRPDGSILAEGRVDIDDFENKFGQFFSDLEREENDTLGGIVFSIAGRVPDRGEILRHNSGIEFEVLDADSRRINRLKIRFLNNESKSVN